MYLKKLCILHRLFTVHMILPSFQLCITVFYFLCLVVPNMTPWTYLSSSPCYIKYDLVICLILYYEMRWDLAECGWDLAEWVVRAPDCQCQSCNNLGFDPSILRHSRIWEAADEAALNKVHKKSKNPLLLWKNTYVGCASAKSGAA
jgi:hypothetical protein